MLHNEIINKLHNEIINNEYIPEINNTTDIPEAAEETDPAVQKMIENLSAHMSKVREETEKQRLEMAKEQEEANIAAAKARMETEKHRREADEYAGISFPDFGEIPEAGEIPAEPVDYQNLLEGILTGLNDISSKELSGDPEIAAIETGHFKDLSENLREVYRQTLSAMEQSRKEAAQIAVYTRKQELLAERIAKLEEEKARMHKTIGKLFEEEKLGANQFIELISNTTQYYNDEINKLIAMMN